MLTLDYTDERTSNGDLHIAISQSEFARFDTSILGLGEISNSPGDQGDNYFDGLAAVFDLEGFTSFAHVPDPQLTVPAYLERFLDWLFRRMRDEFTKEKVDNIVLLWGYFPIFAKFMGDGVLLLWRIRRDTHYGGDPAVGNVVVRLHQICQGYSTDFLPRIKSEISYPPSRLRCGIARGNVIGVGDGRDFVGPCINIASRLQKLGKLSFAVSRVGIDPNECLRGHWRDQYVVKKAPLRGVGDEHLVLVDKKEYNSLSRDNRTFFAEP